MGSVGKRSKVERRSPHWWPAKPSGATYFTFFGFPPLSAPAGAVWAFNSTRPQAIINSRFMGGNTSCLRAGACSGNPGEFASASSAIAHYRLVTGTLDRFALTGMRGLENEVAVAQSGLRVHRRSVETQREDQECRQLHGVIMPAFDGRYAPCTSCSSMTTSPTCSSAAPIFVE